MSDYIWGDKETQFFFELTPDLVLQAVEDLGLKTTGRCLTLNSMENRVYEIEIDNPQAVIPSDHFVVAKFYRPGRWSREQIQDEHDFMFDLQAEEVPVVAPLRFESESLFQLKEHQLLYTLFPKKGGRLVDEFSVEQLQIMGRMLARLHNVGAVKAASHRIQISPDSFGLQNLRFLLESRLLPAHLEASYQQVVEELCARMQPLFKKAATHRVHGDCHLGNIIWRPDEGPFFIDFDDMLMGPAVQDIWLVVPGTDSYAVNDREVLLEAYENMRSFDRSQLKLIEPLRALRFIHFSAWIGKRWNDPAFQRAFPHFGSAQYWDGQLADLRLQAEKI